MPDPLCTVCGGPGVLESCDKPRGLVPCECQTDDERWTAARIPERFWNVPVSAFPEGEIAVSRYIWGPSGHGKTTRAIGIGKRFFRARLSGLFVDLPEHEKERRRAVETGEDVSERVLHAPFQIADDLCREPRTTDFWREFLELHVRERYNKNLPTIWTSNHPLERIEDLLGEHIASRIAEMCGDRIEHLLARNWRVA